MRWHRAARVGRQAERAREHVGAAARDGREGGPLRRLGHLHQPVDHLVHGAVAAERHDQVVPVRRRGGGELARVAAILCLPGIEVKPGAERADHQAGVPSGHGSRAGIDDQQRAHVAQVNGAGKDARLWVCVLPATFPVRGCFCWPRRRRPRRRPVRGDRAQRDRLGLWPRLDGLERDRVHRARGRRLAMAWPLVALGIARVRPWSRTPAVHDPGVHRHRSASGCSRRTASAGASPRCCSPSPASPGCSRRRACGPWRLRSAASRLLRQSPASRSVSRRR